MVSTHTVKSHPVSVMHYTFPIKTAVLGLDLVSIQDNGLNRTRDFLLRTVKARNRFLSNSPRPGIDGLK
jgi:hypothetical protein